MVSLVLVLMWSQKIQKTYLLIYHALISCNIILLPIISKSVEYNRLKFANLHKLIFPSKFWEILWHDMILLKGHLSILQNFTLWKRAQFGGKIRNFFSWSCRVLNMAFSIIAQGNYTNLIEAIREGFRKTIIVLGGGRGQGAG